MKWNEHELETRETLITYLSRELNKINSAFRFMRIETPILLPYTVDKERVQSVRIRLDNEELVLRENTVTGAYEASRDILSGKAGPKQRLPIVVWQHGKVFERRNNVIHELHNLEYQMLYSKTTAFAYEPIIAHACGNMIYKQCGQITENATPGLYVAATEDTGETLVTIRERNDFWAGKNIEVIINMDACTTAAIRMEKRGRIKKALKAS